LISPDQQSTEGIHRMTDSNIVQLKTPTEDTLGDLIKRGSTASCHALAAHQGDQSD